MTRPILTSWKEIAHYLGRGLRTVQRWEASGLPIHRRNGARVVLAYTEELDTWVRAQRRGNTQEIETALEEINYLVAERELLSGEIAELKAEKNSLARRSLHIVPHTELHLGARAEQVCSLSEAAQRKTLELIKWSLEMGLRLHQRQKLRLITLALDVARTYCALAEAPIRRAPNVKRQQFVATARKELAMVAHVLPTCVRDFGAGRRGGAHRTG